MAEEPQPNVGSSQLTVFVPGAIPLPPDVAVAGQDPGGVLLPCTPNSGNAPLVDRNQYALKFLEGQGTQLSIKRIYIVLPVTMSEDELETQTTTSEDRTFYKTEVERKEAEEGLGGLPLQSQTLTPISGDGRFTKISSVFSVHSELQALKTTAEITTTTSVLPVTLTVVARILGPEGPMWSQAFPVEMRYVFGAAGKAAGAGRIETYVDLQNPLVINPERVYSLALFVYIPSTVPTNTKLGHEIIGGADSVGKGEITLFYNVEPVAMRK